MNTSIRKIGLLLGTVFMLFGSLQVSAVTLGDVAPLGESTQCIDLKNNLIITSRDHATNGEVTLLQEFLQRGGFLATDPTGYFGTQTKAAVMKFQKSVDLIDSGYVATYTRAAIKKATCGTISSGAVSSTKVCAYEGTVFGGSAPCTAAIEGSTANGSKCSCTTVSSSTQGAGSQSPGSKISQAKVTISNSLSGPWSASGSSICNVGKVYIQASSLSKSAGAKGCIAPTGSSCTPRDFYNDEWVNESTMIATMSPGEFPNGSYDTYLSYPGEVATKVGSLTLKSCASTKVCAYEGTVFGGSAPCTAAIEGSTANGSKCSCTLTPVTTSAATSGTGAKVCAYEGAVFGGSPTCTEATEGQNHGSRCTCKISGVTTATQVTSSTQSSSGSAVSSATLPPNFPYTFTNESTASANIVTRIKLTLKGTASKPLGTSLKGCTKPVGSTGCTFESEFSLVKGLPGWVYNSQNDTYSIDRDVSKEFLPNVEYVSYIRVFDGSRYEVKWKAKVPTTTTSATTNTQSTQSGGAVFGAGVQGVPYSQPVTYSWVVYAGSMLGQQSASNLGWSEPSTPCTASNAGATYYLGTSSSGSQVVAVCNPSNQGVTSFSTVDASTINAPVQNSAPAQSVQTQSTAAQTAIPPRVPTYARGMFTNENSQQVEWACGDADAGAPADATGWVAQGSGCYHRIVQ